MSIVDEKGAIRNAIRGIENEEYHKCLFEPIDDRQHSLSKNVFIDFNIHEKSILIGFENCATESQINNMTRWYTCQDIHNENGMATASVGLKYWEYLAYGKQYHGSCFIDEEGNKTYYESSAETDVIFEAARNPNKSETEFTQTLLSKTKSVQTKSKEEVGNAYIDIFENKDNKYPFSPKTIILSRKIANEKLLFDLQQDSIIRALRRELMTKYFEEIFEGKLKLWVKFHKDSEFKLLEASNKADPVGLTIGENKYDMNIWELQEDFNPKEKVPNRSKKSKTKQNKLTLFKGTFIYEISNKFFFVKPNGNSSERFLIPSEEIAQMNLRKLFLFHQFTIPEELVENVEENMITKAMEHYCGIYLKIGDSIINSKPLPTQNLRTKGYKARLYRGVLEVYPESVQYIKNKLMLNGLKAKFNLSDMRELNEIIIQAVMLHKKWAWCTDTDKDKNPEKYVCGKLHNEKTIQEDTKSKCQHIYIICVGKNFYKVGKHGLSNEERLTDYLQKNEKIKTKQDFANEEIHEHPYLVFKTIKPIKNAASLEQSIKEKLVDLIDVDTYDNKQGGEIREYFHCENPQTLEEIREYICKESKY